MEASVRSRRQPCALALWHLVATSRVSGSIYRWRLQLAAATGGCNRRLQPTCVCLKMVDILFPICSKFNAAKDDKPWDLGVPVSTILFTEIHNDKSCRAIPAWWPIYRCLHLGRNGNGNDSQQHLLRHVDPYSIIFEHL